MDQCPSHMPRDGAPCEKTAGHAGPHYAWLAGYGPVQWPNQKEAPR